ncbi:MAG: DUF2939 domain-containing protein [Candidatus Muirbacterium halophilum]|nr:DUF2939 domain-containing protein [Candidatus Muirbacterium halophilum]MCK9475915.1 DUF2939 domain-containing protein [Candidatus Muirbacterium halophilum]
MKKLAVIVVIFVVLGLFFIGGPFYTLYKFKSGFDSNNAIKVISCIDFELLRPNIKKQLAKNMTKDKNMELESNPMAVFFEKFVSKIADNLLNTYVSPEGITELLDKRKEIEQDDSIDKQNDNNNDISKNINIDELMEKYKISKIGKDEFHLSLNPFKPEKKIDVVLNRYGISWKITNIIFPERFFDNFNK